MGLEAVERHEFLPVDAERAGLAHRAVLQVVVEEHLHRSGALHGEQILAAINGDGRSSKAHAAAFQMSRLAEHLHFRLRRVGLGGLQRIAGDQQRLCRPPSFASLSGTRDRWALLALSSFFPLLAADPRFHLLKLLRLAVGVVPFSCILGFVTPMLVDRWSEGDPDRAGHAYAINIIGCILGPLVAGFLLLPLLSERWVLFVLALPWLAIGLGPGWSSTSELVTVVPRWQRIGSYAVALVAIGFHQQSL